AALPLEKVSEITIDTGAVERLDLSGAWLLREFLDRAEAGGARKVGFSGERPAQLALIDRTRAEDAEAARARPPMEEAEESPVAAVGRTAVIQWRGIRDGLDFLGRI